jgi:hypothetical protein
MTAFSRLKLPRFLLLKLTQEVINILINWLNTFIAHTSILSNAHGAWPMFWPVVRYHILRWDCSVLPLAHRICIFQLYLNHSI